jgi:hypothetical protein
MQILSDLNKAYIPPLSLMTAHDENSEEELDLLQILPFGQDNRGQIDFLLSE